MAFRDRAEAGKVLAAKLVAYRGRPDVVVLGLARGGMPVAELVAEALEAPLDVLVVRKLGMPGNPELAMGAIASGGARVLNAQTIAHAGISAETVEAVTRAEAREVERRERSYRQGQPALDVEGKTVILVDDGLATGASMRAAIEALRERKAGAVVVAVPIGAVESCRELSAEVDDLVCAVTPEPFVSVGAFYDDFSATGDDQVSAALARGGRPPARKPAKPARTERPTPTALLADLCRRHAVPLPGYANDYDDLLGLVGDARIVLIGDASHGTHEFYRERAIVTERLIEEKGFTAVAVEADWPDAYRVNRFVRGVGADHDAASALGGFVRFPAWMWRNTDVLDFVEWLRDHNDHRENGGKVGFYGIDLYSLYSSMAAVVEYLDRVDPAAAQRARDRYACFEATGDDGQQYGYATGLGLLPSCESEVVAQLEELRRHALELAEAARLDGDERFFAEQNARVAKNAEAYYRAMFRGRISSWNLRDRHMMDTLDALVSHLREQGEAKVVVWAHNSHLGDARATDMAAVGELNLGQLVREKWGRDARLIGFTTFTGSVAAASSWGAPVERKLVKPALPDSYEAIFHATALPHFLLPLVTANPAVAALAVQRLQRAIGVIYLPQSERVSHYLHARLPAQFDAVVHLDETRAVEPLDRAAGWQPGELPETFPSAV